MKGFVTRRLLRLTDAVGRYRNRRGVLVHVLVWSIVVQVLRITQAYVLALGLGMTVPFTYFLLFMPLGLLMLLLPISISGFGLPQGVIVWLLQPDGRARQRSLRPVDVDCAHRTRRQSAGVIPLAPRQKSSKI